MSSCATFNCSLSSSGGAGVISPKDDDAEEYAGDKLRGFPHINGNRAEIDCLGARFCQRMIAFGRVMVLSCDVFAHGDY